MKAPPPPRFTRQPQKEKMFLVFWICARPIFSEKGKDIFLFGVLPSKYSGSVAGLQYGLGKAEKRFFWGKRIFRFASASVPPAERGLGNECGRVLHFGFWRKLTN
jgi:hypothetical protein